MILHIYYLLKCIDISYAVLYIKFKSNQVFTFWNEFVIN